MGYALFAQKKLVLDGQINAIQLQHTQRSDEQMRLATSTLNLQTKLTSIQAAQSGELGDLYDELASAETSGERATVQAEIEKMQKNFEQEIQTINNQIYQVSIKENAVEMEVKRLDTKITALQKQMEKIQEAEGKGIDGATPSFNGLG